MAAARAWPKVSLDITSDDIHEILDNYNMARACSGMADMEKTLKHLHTALRLNKDLELAQKFLAYLEKNDLLPKDFLEEEAPTAD